MNAALRPRSPHPGLEITATKAGHIPTQAKCYGNSSPRDHQRIRYALAGAERPMTVIKHVIIVLNTRPSAADTRLLIEHGKPQACRGRQTLRATTSPLLFYSKRHDDPPLTT